MADPRYASTNLEAYRITPLDSTGNFTTEDPGLYVCDDGISFASAFTTQAGTTYQQNVGSGRPCVNRVGPTRVTGATVTIAICSWQARLAQLIFGGKVAPNGAGDAIGWSGPDPDDANVRYFCLEAWSLAVDNDRQADYQGDALWIHHIWPMGTAYPSDFTLEDAVTPSGAVVTVNPNSNIGNGPFNDWPDFEEYNGTVLLDGHPTGTYAWFYDENPPAALCVPTAFTSPAS